MQKFISDTLLRGRESIIYAFKQLRKKLKQKGKGETQIEILTVKAENLIPAQTEVNQKTLKKYTLSRKHARNVKEFHDKAVTTQTNDRREIHQTDTVHRSIKERAPEERGSCDQPSEKNSVEFINENTLVLKSKRNDSYCNNTSSFDMLPNEVIVIILDMAIKSSSFAWPNHVCSVVQRLRGVCSRFTRCVDMVKPKLPRVHIPAAEPGLRSVCSLTRKFGQYSGLIMAVKQIIAHAQWNRAWLLLVADRFGWFIVKNIFWKKRKD